MHADGAAQDVEQNPQVWTNCGDVRVKGGAVDCAAPTNARTDKFCSKRAHQCATSSKLRTKQCVGTCSCGAVSCTDRLKNGKCATLKAKKRRDTHTDLAVNDNTIESRIQQSQCMLHCSYVEATGIGVLSSQPTITQPCPTEAQRLIPSQQQIHILELLQE